MQQPWETLVTEYPAVIADVCVVFCGLAPVKLWNWHDDVINWKLFPRKWPFVRGTTGDRWIPLKKACDAELSCFLWSAPEQTFEQTIDTPVIWDVHRVHYDDTVMDF